MPSPPSTAIFMSSREQPRLLAPMLVFERANLVGVLEREPNIVKAVQNAALAEGIDVEAKAFAAGRRYGLLLKIDRKAIALLRLGFAQQPVDGLLIELDEHEP